VWETVSPYQGLDDKKIGGGSVSEPGLQKNNVPRRGREEDGVGDPKGGFFLPGTLLDPSLKTDRTTRGGGRRTILFSLAS